MTNNAGNQARPPVVFYDGGCSLCRREIAHYRRIEGAQHLVWIDITREPRRVRAYGITVEQAMASFHVLDGQGRWHRGARAFFELWSRLRYYRWLAATLRALRLAKPLEIAYRRWADWRVRRRCGNSCGVTDG